MSVEFCDTNVIVYAYDVASPRKRPQAEALLDRLWHAGSGAMSVQVLQEMFVSLTRRLPQPLSPSDARRIVAHYASWPLVISPVADDVLDAIDLSQRWQTSFWDGMVLMAARKAGASILWTEDLNHGQVYDGVTVQNPFR